MKKLNEYGSTICDLGELHTKFGEAIDELDRSALLIKAYRFSTSIASLSGVTGFLRNR